MSKQIIPLVSSGVSGPLGVLHLPRLWQKASLEAAGKLHSDYPGAGQGYDQMVLDGLGLSRDAFLAFIRTAKPTYVQFEAWVLEQKGGKLDATAIEKLNAAIRGYNHDDATRGALLAFVGRKDDGTVKDAITLNNLDDWQAFYNAELA